MIQLHQLTLRRGRQVLLEGADLRLHRGWKVGVTGRNGCGKSSLFALILGELQPDAGDCRLPAGTVIAHVAQETPATPRPAIEYVLDGDQELRRLERELEQARREDDGNRLGELHAALEHIGGYQARARAGTLLHGLGFAPDDHERPVVEFSGGWRMRLNLARALMCRSDLLLLDEPTNHLDLEAVLWLEGWLRNYDGTLLLISHDREFLDAVVDHVLHLRAGQARLYSGNYSEQERQLAEELAHQRALQRRQQREIQHIRSFVNRFRAKATKARQAQSRLKALERMEIISVAHVDAPFHFGFRPPEALPAPLLALEEVSVGHDGTPLLGPLDLRIAPGDRIGLLGRNGAGKSTLIRLLAGELEPLSGRVEQAKKLVTGYFAQHQLEQLDPEASPLLHLRRQEPDRREQELLDYLGAFDFGADRADTPCRHFSGGEKARLVLALLIRRHPNLLLLDEPTNHLDLEMRHALTVALQEFQGALVIVSHDRHLLRTTTDTLLLVENGRVEPFPGDLDDYAGRVLPRPGTGNGQAARKGAGHSAAARQARRREAALSRQRRRPLVRRLRELESEMESTRGSLAAIEQELADPGLYQGEENARLQQLLQEQGRLRKELERCEEQWLELQEELEALTE